MFVQLSTTSKNHKSEIATIEKRLMPILPRIGRIVTNPVYRFQVAGGVFSLGVFLFPNTLGLEVS